MAWKDLIVFTCTLTLILCCSCRSDSAQGEVIIRNDIQDAEFNQITVDEIISTKGKLSFNKTLNPGDEIAIPGRGITSLKVSRKYTDYTAIYVVKCPAKKDRTLMKLIDIYLNKLPNGCKMTARGEKRNGITQWK